MPIGVRDEKEASVVAWAGWDASMLDALLDSETGPDAIGFTLARVLATRLLPSPAARFRFRLYRYCHESGTYQFVGAWNERCLEEDARPVPPEALERSESSVEPPDPDLRTERFYEDEFFLPLETKNGVLGFGVLRVDSRHELTMVSSQDLQFLGRLAGAALSRLNESDRAVRMHRSFESASRHLDAVLDLTSEAILLVDVNGVVRIANESALKLLRRTGRELLGQRISAALRVEASEALHRALLQAEESEGRIAAEILLESDGALAPYEVAVQQLQPDLEVDPTLLVRFRRSGGCPGAELRTTGRADAGIADEKTMPGAERNGSSSRATGADHGSRESERSSTAAGPRSVTAGPVSGGDPFVLGVDEAETLRRHVRSIRGYLGLLRDESEPTGRAVDHFLQLEVQLEWLQAQTDVHALLESIRTEQVSWRNRSIRAASLVDRALSRVSARLSVRAIEVDRRVDLETGRVQLDPEKWSIVLGVLIDRMTDDPHVSGLTVTLREADSLTIVLEPTTEGDGVARLAQKLDEDDRSHAMVLVNHAVRSHRGSLRVAPNEHGVPTIRLEIPKSRNERQRHGSAA
ncbi:MAG: PAS domain-containing protein [Candidatus Eisenbacteria bacterium]